MKWKYTNGKESLCDSADYQDRQLMGTEGVSDPMVKRQLDAAIEKGHKIYVEQETELNVCFLPNHPKKFIVVSEDGVIQSVFGPRGVDLDLVWQLTNWLDKQEITSENIGEIRRACFMPWSSGWNAIVREETALRENKPPARKPDPEPAGVI